MHCIFNALTVSSLGYHSPCNQKLYHFTRRLLQLTVTWP